jgi:hypothetical protein
VRLIEVCTAEFLPVISAGCKAWSQSGLLNNQLADATGTLIPIKKGPRRLMPERRFRPPWTVEEQAACFIVPDQSGQALAYIYYENEPGAASGG